MYVMQRNPTDSEGVLRDLKDASPLSPRQLPSLERDNDLFPLVHILPRYLGFLLRILRISYDSCDFSGVLEICSACLLFLRILRNADDAFALLHSCFFIMS